MQLQDKFMVKNKTAYFGEVFNYLKEQTQF